MQGITAEKRIEENRQRILDVAQEFVDRFTDEKMVTSMPPVIRFRTKCKTKFFHFSYILYNTEPLQPIQPITRPSIIPIT